MRRFQSPIIEAEQWIGQDIHLGVRKNNSAVGTVCESCGRPYNECGQYDERNAPNLIVCIGDYITSDGRVRPKLYFEDTYIEIE